MRAAIWELPCLAMEKFSWSWIRKRYCRERATRRSWNRRPRRELLCRGRGNLAATVAGNAESLGRLDPVHSPSHSGFADRLRGPTSADWTMRRRLGPTMDTVTPSTLALPSDDEPDGPPVT